MTEEVLEQKNLWGLLNVCIGMLICFSFAHTMQYLYRTDRIDERLDDLKLVTIDDYTVQTRLPAGLYEKFIEDQGTHFTDEDIPINKFTEAMSLSIKRQIANAEGSNVTEEDLHIVDIHFGFNNTTIYKLLEKRS